MKQQKTSKPVPIEELIKDFFREHKSTKTTFQEKIVKKWTKVLPKNANKHTRPVAIKNRTLIISVSTNIKKNKPAVKKR